MEVQWSTAPTLADGGTHRDREERLPRGSAAEQRIPEPGTVRDLGGAHSQFVGDRSAAATKGGQEFSAQSRLGRSIQAAS